MSQDPAVLKRRIAEWMGGIYKKSERTGNIDNERIYLGEDEAMYFVAYNPSTHRYRLLYDESFDWIMPVIEKMSNIDGLSIDMEITGGASFWRVIQKTGSETDNTQDWEVICEGHNKILITAYYELVNAYLDATE